jgi:hypothetical protein
MIGFLSNLTAAGPAPLRWPPGAAEKWLQTPEKGRILGFHVRATDV